LTGTGKANSGQREVIRFAGQVTPWRAFHISELVHKS
jgi:hypothetical protein